MEKLGDKVLQKIKEEKIVPRPRWQFLLKDYFIWLIFLVSLMFGSLAFCVLLHIFFTNDWDLYKYFHTTLIGHILISIPYIWIVLMTFFVGVAYYNFKYTKSGYRRETYFVVALSVAGSLILGTFLHTLGAGEKIEDIVANSVPYYEKITCCSDRKDIWDQPEKGFLGGEIVNILNAENFELKDFGGLVWQVQENDDTIEYAPLEIKNGEEVKIIGEKERNYVFWAREIRPWKKGGEFSIHKAKVRIDLDK
jgi:hypothetical protein